MEITLVFVISAFVAGLLMFLAPCTLPLIPAYLAFMSGVQQKEAITDRVLQQKILINAVAFTVGFSTVFISFGILAGFAGSFIGPFRGILTQIGGVVIIVFGLRMLHMLHLPLFSRGGSSLPLPSMFTPGKPSSAALIGGTFALGWTPCVGPILASVLLLATTSQTALTGGVLLGIFSLGLAIPFILTALLYARAGNYIARYAWITKGIEIVGGLFLVLIGVLLLTDNFDRIIQYGYELFEYLGLSSLFNYF